MMDFSAEAILERLKSGLQSQTNQTEGGFTMDNLQAVAEELARFHAMSVIPLQEQLEENKSGICTSGNERHYEQWAKEVKDEYGNWIVGNARAVGMRDGTGLVQVAIISTAAGVPNETTIKMVSEYIETQRPVGAKPVVVAAQAIAVTIDGTLAIKAGYSEEGVTREARMRIQEYFTEIAFRQSAAALSYYKIGNILYSIDGVLDVITYEVNGKKESISAKYDEFFELTEVTLHGLV